MQIQEFRSIVSTFSDPGTEMLFDKNQMVISVNGDLIEAKISTRDGDVFVEENEAQFSASSWVINRLARLPILAARLRSSINRTPFFISPSASLLPTLEKGPGGSEVHTEDAVETTLLTLDGRSPLETTVLYITSDAGEGKTSLIHELSLAQANRFKERTSDWLLVPIPLGGRHFLRFDDITIGALQNRYRFPFLYYDSFIALVRMGVIVPAFDGFEEMFVEGSSGEALSAMGILVGSLDSRGAMIVAARKAYFEFESLSTQERLFDTIRTHSVGFGKLELNRWSKDEFVAYCKKRGIGDAEELYRKVSDRLTPDHALLTRAVLVKRLVDVASEASSLDSLLLKLKESGVDFFSVFVTSLIEREANEKWIDRSGEKEVGSPLLTVPEHFELLSLVAMAMWESKVDSLKRDSLEFVAEYFSESSGKNAFQAQQIKERIRGHAMLVPSSNIDQALEFDHDEFRLFFLGEAIGHQVSAMNDRSKAELFSTFRRGLLPKQAQLAFTRAVLRNRSLEPLKVTELLFDVGRMDGQVSYTQENCSDLAIQLIDGIDCGGLIVSNFAFGVDSLKGINLRNIVFRRCYFAASSLESTKMTMCSFDACTFSQLRLDGSQEIVKAIFAECKVESLICAGGYQEIWDPVDIARKLKEIGIVLESERPVGVGDSKGYSPDIELQDVEKLLRYFMRSTHISESVMLIKLGVRGRVFIDSVLPRLLKSGVLVEIENRGGGDQRRFSLGVSLKNLQKISSDSFGSFNKFLTGFERLRESTENRAGHD